MLPKGEPLLLRCFPDSKRTASVQLDPQKQHHSPAAAQLSSGAHFSLHPQSWTQHQDHTEYQRDERLRCTDPTLCYRWRGAGFDGWFNVTYKSAHAKLK